MARYTITTTFNVTIEDEAKVREGLEQLLNPAPGTDDVVLEAETHLRALGAPIGQVLENAVMRFVTAVSIMDGMARRNMGASAQAVLQPEDED